MWNRIMGVLVRIGWWFVPESVTDYGEPDSRGTLIRTDTDALKAIAKELTIDTSGRIRIEVYKDKKGEHRWRVTSIGNGKILATSSEGYKSRQSLNKTLNLLRDQFGTADVVQ